MGAGIAGLSCALRLQLAGYDVELLERESTPGGRMQSEVHGDFTIERGAECVSQGDRNLHVLLAALDLQASVRSLARSDDAVFHEGRFVAADWGGPGGLIRSSVLSPVSRARLARLGLDLARHRRVLDPLHPERAVRLDHEDAESYLGRAVGRDARDSLIAPLLSADLSCDMRELSRAAALLALRQAGGQGTLLCAVCCQTQAGGTT